jgi:hypothetical protein
MRSSGFVEMVGRERFAGDIFKALEIAEGHLETLRAKNELHFTS